jgi:HEPN domain-containing protein
MVDPEIISEWITKADEDFEFALINQKEGRSFYAQICFHFQQSAEKYLKAFIIANELEFRRSHELPLLLNICLSKDPSFKELREDCEYLTTFYIETRYPVHWPMHFSNQESKKCSETAGRIQSFVKKKMVID